MSYVLSTLDSLDEFGPSLGQTSPIKSRINNFVQSGIAQGAIHHTASKVLNTVKDNHKQILSSAIMVGLNHVAGIDMPGDVHEMVHNQIEHLGTSLSISKTMAHAALTHAVGKFKELRGIKEHEDKDDELDQAIVRLHQILKEIEPHYQDHGKKVK
jgi:hypothetical protein